MVIVIPEPAIPLIELAILLLVMSALAQALKLLFPLPITVITGKTVIRAIVQQQNGGLPAMVQVPAEPPPTTLILIAKP